MQISDVRKPYIRIEVPPNTQNSNERMIVHLKSDPFLAENVSNTAEGGYTTGDIFLEDPPNSGQYLILGRQDDTLVHITGEKTNPVLIEEAIRRSPVVEQVAVVGHNQFCTAALVQLNVEEASKYSTKEIEQKIWDVVEQVNKQVPSHSCLVRPLIQILAENETLPVTHKGNIMRRKINQEFSTLIDTMYDKFLNQQQQQRTAVRKERPKWTREEIRTYLEEKLNSLVQSSDATKEDLSSRSIFDFGINSLQVVELRNWICQDICEVPKNFVYEHASIDQMTEELLVGDLQEQVDPHHYLLTEMLIDKYVEMMKAVDVPSITDQPPGQRVFLLTGANGSLGNFVVRDLLNQPTNVVKRVYCLLRGSDTRQRLLESFEQRQLDTSLLTDRLVILPSSMNLSDEHLGQPGEVYEQLQKEVTDIIHSAWKMNFNQTVKDFEQDSIRGVYNLLRLAAGSKRMQFHFISSIASAGSGLLSEVKEEPLPRRAEIAFPQGYGQSKYVSEHLCWAAMTLWSKFSRSESSVLMNCFLEVPVSVYRVGQVSGDTQNGIWNTTELAPMMIYAGAGQLKKMPMVGEDVNWIPVDVCSRSLVDLALKSSSDLSANERVYHLLNPRSIRYEDYLDCLRVAGLTFDTVTPQEFVDTILTATDISNPLVKLSAFFEQIYSSKHKLKRSHYQTVKTVERCEPLKQCPPVDVKLIQLYLNYWKHCQVLPE